MKLPDRYFVTVGESETRCFSRGDRYQSACFHSRLGKAIEFGLTERQQRAIEYGWEARSAQKPWCCWMPNSDIPRYALNG